MANSKDQDLEKKSQEELDAAAKAEADAKAKADADAGKGTGEDDSAGKGKEKSASWEEEIKRRDGTISALQTKLDNLTKGLIGALNPEGDKEKELTVQDLLKEINDLKQENQTAKSEKARDAYIDSLEVSEARKKELKRRVSPSSEDIAKAVDEENNALNILLQNEGVSSKDNNNTNRFISNKRPAAASNGRSIPNSDNAAEILAAAEGK